MLLTVLPSWTTSQLPIKEQRCGLSAIATVQSTNPFLFIVQGPVQSNHTPDNAALLAKTKELFTGQAKTITEMPDLKAQPKDTTVLLDPLNKMLTDPEGNYQSPQSSMGSEGHCSDCLNVRLETKEID
ncbi:hypothetical protein HPB52_014844 [Rhipicephalus sanguineus]|uniref:Uncharacterized protein n=1 Tax=Rhipicephalus sanguineus TaxID=34632 RepID=A0A9D4SWF3_RHISA|nr:hypothetical protein HPB52_014844 [Rhipicephalus sanguineus]